jgi:DNA repair protein RecO (recombination protein O)
MHSHDEAYVIYNVHFQESSALIKLLTKNHGVISAVVRGVHQKGKKSNATRAALQLGNLVECDWFGHSSLKTISHLDSLKNHHFDTANKFICLSYIHELILFFTRENAFIENIFALYNDVINALCGNNIEVGLREFELALLESLGYGIDFSWDVTTQDAVKRECLYKVTPELGVSLVNVIENDIYAGEVLLQLQQRYFVSHEVLLVAKKICRQLLQFHMDGKPLKSRRLYRELFNAD